MDLMCDVTHRRRGCGQTCGRCPRPPPGSSFLRGGRQGSCRLAGPSRSCLAEPITWITGITIAVAAAVVLLLLCLSVVATAAVDSLMFWFSHL